MKPSAVIGLAASVLMLFNAVPAGAQPKPTPATGQTARPTVTGQSSTSAIETPAPSPGPRPLFTAGNVNVGIWAPVEPPYNANANRSQASNPVWQEDMARPSGF